MFIIVIECSINRKNSKYSCFIFIDFSYSKVKFKLKVVDDKLVYIDELDKRKGYNLKHGKNTLKTGLVQEVTAKAGRVWSKKKQ